jgi:hypothetical protein
MFGSSIAGSSHLYEVPHWICWLVGGVRRTPEVTFETELREIAHRNGLTAESGSSVNAPTWLSSCRLSKSTANQSRTEAFGIAFVEALYAVCQLVTTAMREALEIVTERCGLHVPPLVTQSAGKRVAAACQDPPLRAAPGAAGRPREQCHTFSQLGLLEGLVQCVCRAAPARKPRPEHSPNALQSPRDKAYAVTTQRQQDIYDGETS